MGTVALGLGWLTSPLSVAILTLVGAVAAVIGTWAAVVSVRAARRGLYVSTEKVDPIWDVQLADRYPGAKPHQMIILFTLRGSTAIQDSDFDRNSGLVFDVGADIIEVSECRTDPPQAPKPEFSFQENYLTLRPFLINPGTNVRMLLRIKEPPGPIKCTDAVLANVRVQSVQDAKTKSRAYLTHLAFLPGAVVILAALVVPHVAHAFTATCGYKVVAIVACLIAILIIIAFLAAWGTKITRRLLAAALSVTVLLGLVATAAPVIASLVKPDPHPHGCPSMGGVDWVAKFHAGPGDDETVGYSSSPKEVFVNQSFPDESQAQLTQDQRIKRDEQQIFAMNAQVDCLYQQDHAAGGDRQVVELAYFAGLTEGVDEDYDSGEAEELEGLLAAQMDSLSGDNPLLKIVVANGGSKMQDAVQVAGRLVALAREDHTLLGVVGMDRSTTQVKAAIQLFAKNQVPVLATTLSADGIGQGSRPYYYELTPPNSSEATLIRQYIQRVVHAYFEQVASRYPSGGSTVATKIVIEEPNQNPDDLYIHTLVHDLTTEAWRPFGLPQPQVIYAPGKALCGDSVVDIYAGRHDKPVTGAPYDNDFSGFLSYIAESCTGPQPFIIADDGVTRFVADPAARADSTSYGLTISYVTKGIATLQTGTACLHARSAANYSGHFGTFCQTYAQIVATLRHKVKGLNFLWTGERVGLAYDAAELFLTAVNRGGPLSPAQIPHQFQQDGEVRGVIGAVNFALSNIGSNSGMPMAVVRLDLSKATTTPTCAFPGRPGHLYGPGPGHGDCPNNQN